MKNSFLLCVFFVTNLARAHPCISRDPFLEADLNDATLWLCERGAAVYSFHIAKGKGGIAKRREGDSKTPLGLYPLGESRPSEKFHIFIPIEYPTGAQTQKGYTGSAIGLHGPPRYFSIIGPLLGLVDWTEGCLAVGTTWQIEFIARWVARHHVKHIYLY